MIVPFKRVIKLGTRGNDVRAVKRTLWKQGMLGWKPRFEAVMGPTAMRALHKWQKKHGLKATNYNRVTHRKLAPRMDKTARHLYNSFYTGKAREDALRAKIVANGLWGYNNRSQIHYRQSRPIDGYREPYKLPLWTDCSGFVTDCYVWAGAGDPNGRFDGLGYTGTLDDIGRQVSKNMAKPGDIVLYGGGNHNHTALYVGHGRVVSHGSEGGPYLLPIDYRGDRNMIINTLTGKV